MLIPAEKMNISERVKLGVFTHDDVPVPLARLLVERIRSGETMNADKFVNAHYDGLRGHALNPHQLKFKNVSLLRSALIVANADPGRKWHSFGVLMVVSPPPLPDSQIFQRVDFYSVAPRASTDPLYVGDVCLRLDVAKDGGVLDASFNLVRDADNPAVFSVYGTMLYVAALAVSAAEVEVLA